MYVLNYKTIPSTSTSDENDYVIPKQSVSNESHKCVQDEMSFGETDDKDELLLSIPNELLDSTVVNRQKK